MIAPRPIFSGAFLRGMAQAFDLTGSIASRRLAGFRRPRRTVRRTLSSNWAALGRDLGLAMRRYREQHGQ